MEAGASLRRGITEAAGGEAMGLDVGGRGWRRRCARGWGGAGGNGRPAVGQEGMGGRQRRGRVGAAGGRVGR